MYKQLLKNPEKFEVKYPKTIVPQPTETDYEVGFIRRYFAKKSNNVYGYVFEISEETYAEYVNKKSPMWVATNVKWRIKGPIEKTFKPDGTIQDIGVRDSNKAALGIVSATIPNIKLYLPNLLQFYRP
jgi:hypothetical protein